MTISKQRIHNMLARGNQALEDELECINTGGCGFVAVEMHHALNAHGIENEIVLLNNCYSIPSVKRFIDDYGDGCINSAYLNLFKDLPYDAHVRPDPQNGHVGIKFDGKVYDYSGEWYGHAISEHIRPEVMEIFLINHSVWNHVFRMANRHREVRRVLKDFFSAVCNKHLTWELTI